MSALLDRPSRNLTHSSALNGIRRPRRHKTTRTERRQNVPHLERVVAEKIIATEIDSALSQGYQRRCEFLNHLVQVIAETKPDSLNVPEFFELICTKVLLFLEDDHPAIRAMCFRLLRLCLFTGNHLTFMLQLHADIYIVRAFDLNIQNDSERLEALRLISKMINAYQNSYLRKLIEAASTKTSEKKYAFPKSIMQPVIAVALDTINNCSIREDSGPKSNEDNLGWAAVALFLEFCVYEPRIAVDMAGTGWMVDVLTGASLVNKRIAGLVSRVLVAWMDDSVTRTRAQLHLVLEQIFAPLVEFGFFQSDSTQTNEKITVEVMETFSYSFLCILRSWSGLFACAAVGPNSSIIASSPLRLLEYLGLGTVNNSNMATIRDMIVNICCEFMDAPYAKCTFTSWNEALDFYRSMTSADTFASSLKDDFVLAQSSIMELNDGEFCRHVDLVYSFRSLAFYILINASLPQSLARLIVAQPDAPSSLKATLLMSDFLRMAPSIVPVGWRASVLSMPTLVQSAFEALTASRAAAATHGDSLPNSGGEQYEFVHAENAALILHRFDTLNGIWLHHASFKSAPDSNFSLFMMHRQKSFPSMWEKSSRATMAMIAECSETEELNLKCCLKIFNDILEQMPDPSDSTAAMALADCMKKFDRMDDVVTLIGRVMNEMLPSQGRHTRWNRDRTLILTAKKAICLAMRLPVEYRGDAIDYLTEYAVQFKKVLDSAGGGILSTRNLIHSGSMYHFAVIGCFSADRVGLDILTRTGVFQKFQSLMNSSTETEVVKLVVSCLDYSHGKSSLACETLRIALTSTNEQARRWCTRFMAALAALRIPKFCSWGVGYLIGQLGDPCVKVVRNAIRILHIVIPRYPEQSMLQLLLRAPLESLGDAGVLLQAHVFADEVMCQRREKDARDAISHWMESFNMRYYEAIDDDMRVCLLSVRRNMNGSFSRTSGDRWKAFPLPMPLHLFGALARHSTGRALLMSENVCSQLLSRLGDDVPPDLMKSTLLALGNLASCSEGVSLLGTEALPRIIRLAEEADVLSVRGVAFFALNAIAISVEGARELCKFGWESNQHRWIVDKCREEQGETEEKPRRPTILADVPEVPALLNIQEYGRTRCSSTPTTPVRRTRSISDALPSSIIKTRMRRTSSDVALLTADYSNLETDSLQNSRADRTLTMESTGAGSVVESLGSITRRRATTVQSSVDMESRSRSWTVAHCLSQGLFVDKSGLLEEGTTADLLRDPHFSSRNREKWKLQPIRIRRCLQVNRNVGDPVRYIFMTREEEERLSEFRHHMLRDDRLHNRLRAKTQSDAHSMHAAHVIALPSEIQIMCTKIFPHRRGDDLSRIEVSVERERTEATQPHSAYRCFYCGANREKYQLPSDVDLATVASLRRQVLHEVDMLEVKESIPEKKLISLWTSHRWLFEWPCLYADVLELLDEYSFKPRSRSFLQQIFYNALKL